VDIGSGIWKVEAMTSYELKINNKLPINGRIDLDSYDTGAVAYTDALLDAQYPESNTDDFVRIYQPSAPGGPKVYFRIAGVWYKQSFEVVT